MQAVRIATGQEKNVEETKNILVHDHNNPWCEQQSDGNW